MSSTSSQAGNHRPALHENLLALIGCMLGAGFLMAALLKLIFPRETGLWLGPHTLALVAHSPAYSDPLHERELLGWWYVPVALSLASCFLWLATNRMRKSLMRSGADKR